MKSANPRLLLVIGFFLVLMGVILPYLMVVHLVKTTYFLSFVSWGSTVSGLFLGLLGSAYYSRVHKK